jgi:hypothetical protein
VPVISGGGGGGGNTTAQVVASGKVLPVAAPTGVTVDTTTYNDTIKGSGKLTTLVFPAEQGALAIARAGDAYPRYVFSSDAAGFGICLGDGTIDAPNAGGFIGTGPAVGGFGKVSVMSYLDTQVSPALSQGAAPQLIQVSPRFTIVNGALPTVQLVTATGAQIQTGTDSETITPVTFNSGVANTATCLVALSPDNVTYSTLGTESEPIGVALAGTIHLIKVRVPAGWYIKLTVTNAVLGLTTYY